MPSDIPTLTLAEWHYLWHALDYYSDEYGRMGHYEAAKRWLLANRPQAPEPVRAPVDNKPEPM